MSGGVLRSKDVLNRLFQSHQETPLAAFKRATEFEHAGTRGELRETTVSSFLKAVLPGRYGIVRGQAVDSRGGQSRQLDIMIYDRIDNSLLVNSNEMGNALVPAEAVLAVVEVKSSLTAAGMAECIDNARSIRALSPYGGRFATRLGAETYDDQPRCFYSLLSYQSDLAEPTWINSEWRRLTNAAEAKRTDVAIIDRLVVLDRGLLVPPRAKGRASKEADSSLLYWYLHLSSFLARKSPRQKPAQLGNYSEGSLSGWKNLVPKPVAIRSSRATRKTSEQSVRKTAKPGSAR